MAQADIQNILEGLKIGQARRSEAARLGLESARFQAEKEYHLQELQHEEERINQAGQTLELSKKAALLANAKAQQEVSEAMTRGYMPAGATPVAPLPSQSQLVQNMGVPPPVRTFQVPGIEGNITLPSEQDIQEQIRGRAAAQEGPKLEADFARARQAQEAAASLKQTELDAQMALQKEKDRAEDARQSKLRTAQDAAMLARTKLEIGGRTLSSQISAAARVEAAKVGKAYELTNFDPTPYMHQAASGQISEDEIKALPKMQADLVRKGLAQQGIVPLTKDQKKYLEGWGSAKTALDAIDNFNNYRQQNWTLSRVPFSPQEGQLDALQKNAQSAITSLSNNVLGQSSRAMQLALSKDLGAYTPDKMGYASVNQQKRDNLVNAIDETFRQKFGSFSAAQQQMIKDQYGMTPYLMQRQNTVPTPQVEPAPDLNHLYINDLNNPVPSATPFGR